MIVYHNNAPYTVTQVYKGVNSNFQKFYSFCNNNFLFFIHTFRPLLSPRVCSCAPAGVVLLNFLIRGDFRTPLANASRKSIPWGLRLGRIYGWTLSIHYFKAVKISKSSICQTQLPLIDWYPFEKLTAKPTSDGSPGGSSCVLADKVSGQPLLHCAHLAKGAGKSSP